MTTRTGARVYHGASTPLAPGACTHCGRVVTVTYNGRRRRHLDTSGRPCTGGGVSVTPRDTTLSTLPDVVVPDALWERAHQTPQVRLEAGDERCVCGWRPRRKSDGEYAAHRIRPDDPSAPYCPNGAERSRP